MLRFIKGELYKTFHRTYLYVATAIMALCIIGASFVLNSIGLHREKILSFFGIIMVAIMAVLLIFLPMVSDDCKNHTMKNLYMTHLSGKRYFFSKYIVQLITAVVIAVVLYTFLIIGMLSVPFGEEYLGGQFVEFVLKLILAIPVFAVSILVIDVIYFCTGNELYTFLIYYYGYMQIIGLMVLSGGAADNPVFMFFVLPIAASNLSNMPLSITNGIGVVVCGIIYIAFLARLGAKRCEKLKCN